jgi:hypothetical protein
LLLTELLLALLWGQQTQKTWWAFLLGSEKKIAA